VAYKNSDVDLFLYGLPDEEAANKYVLTEPEWSGVEWSGVEWSGVEWSGVEWSGLDWIGLDWIG
jgi:hypothetical protein